MREKYYMVRYDAYQYSNGSRPRGATFAVKATHSNHAIVATHKYCDYKGYKKPYTRVITEQEFLENYEVVPHDNPNVRWTQL
jgi:hypothetical protein